MSPAVRLRHGYVASALGLRIFRPLDFCCTTLDWYNLKIDEHHPVKIILYSTHGHITVLFVED
jgi:hypothetical protein